MPSQVDDVVQDSEPEREQRRRRRDDVADDHSDTFSRFAYKAITRPMPCTVDPGQSRCNTASVARKDTPDSLPDHQLRQLSKCISCGLEWTSRKTAEQKRTHINQCAKKRALSKETIKTLVQKEITVPVPSETTLMDLVVPAGPVKKSKRHQVLPTVMSLPKTRDNILTRAQDILGSTSSHADPQPPLQFGHSALAHRNLKGSMEEPPSTQAFGASSLRGRGTIAEQSVDGHRASLFAQESVLSSDRHKRSHSPPQLANSNSRAVRRRLLQ